MKLSERIVAWAWLPVLVAMIIIVWTLIEQTLPGEASQQAMKLAGIIITAVIGRTLYGVVNDDE